jgi:hypothetical protein
MVRFQLLMCYVVRVPKQTTMTPRSIRRAAERKAMKLARKAARSPQEGATLEAQTPPAGAVLISEARLAANRANAQLGTGPKTPEGKAKVSLNAVKTALTGRTVLLSTDDTEAYARHLAAFEDEYKPTGLRECELVQSIADTYWRLARIPALENAIFAKGRIEFANLFEEHDLEAQPLLIDAHTFLIYEKQIRNLQLQEARLVRRREKETAELRTLQQERNQRQKQALDLASKPKPFNPATDGFEFSFQENEQYGEGVRAANVAQLRHSDSCVLPSAF